MVLPPVLVPGEIYQKGPGVGRDGENTMIRLTAKLTTNPVNQCGLIAGAIGGESIVLLVLVNVIILKNSAGTDIFGNGVLVNLWNAIYPFLIIALFEVWGIFAAWLGIRGLKNRTDALLTGFIAGVMMGILLEVMWIANILSLIASQWGRYAGGFSGYGGTALLIGVLIVFVVMGAVLSGFGSYIFYESRQNKEKIAA
jgi:hypothetical protein